MPAADVSNGAATVTRAVVVSFNTCDLLKRCLRALDGVETHVVDNGSTDGSRALVREHFTHARLHTPERNLGYGQAVNLGAEAAGDWDHLLILNADAAPRPGAVEALVEAAEADPTSGILAPRLVRPDGTVQHACHAFWSPAFALGFATGRASRDHRWGYTNALERSFDPDRPRRVPWAEGACLLVRRAAWAACDGFDPRFWLYAEDVDLGWRASRVGWNTRYVPGATVDHATAASTGAAWGDERTARAIAASYDWMRVRRGATATRVTAALHVAGDLARWSGSPRRERLRYLRWAGRHTIGLRSHRAIRRRLPVPPEPR